MMVLTHGTQTCALRKPKKQQIESAKNTFLKRTNTERPHEKLRFKSPLNIFSTIDGIYHDYHNSLK